VCYSSESLNIFRRKPSCLFESNKCSRFVQFGADQDCHCGAVRCRRKLGVKPNKPKLPASDTALKIVACQVAATSPKLKALLSTRHVCISYNIYNLSLERFGNICVILDELQ